jgi:soluble lytic murein transglycosylase-like protein
MRDQLQTKLGWMREDNQSIINNRNDIAAATAEANRSKQRQRSVNLEELASFSKGVTDLLLDQKKEKDKRDDEEGYYEYWAGNGDPKEIQQFREGEAQLDAANQTVDGVAYKAALAGEPPQVVSRIRELSGKKKFGYLRALAQDKGAGYGSWLYNLISTDDKTQINLGSVTVTPKDALKDPAILAGVAAWARTQFIRQNGLDGANKAMLNEYLFPGMREGEAKTVARYTRAIVNERATAEGDEAASVLISSTKNGTPDLNSYVSRMQSVINPETGMIYGKTGAMDLAFKLLGEMGRSGDEGGLTVDMIQQLMDSPLMDGEKGTWGERHGARFLGLEDTVRNGRQQDANARDAVLQDQGKEYANDMYAFFMSNGGASQDQLDQFEIEWNSRFNGPVPEKIARMRSIEKKSAEESKKYLERKIRNGEPITDEDLQNVDFDVWRQYKPQIEASNKNIAKDDTSKAHIKALEDRLKINLDIQDIGQPTDPTFGLAANRAKQQYIALVTAAVAGNGDLAAAQQNALDKVMNEIELGKATAKGPGQPLVSGTGLYRLEEIGGRKGYVEFLVGGKSRQAMVATEQQLNFIKAKFAGGGKPVIDKFKLVTDQDLATIEKLREDPSGMVPASVEYMARMTGLSTWDVMDRQLKLLDKPLLTKPPSVQYADQDPEFQRLLKSRPSARRVARAFAGKPWAPEKVPNGWGKLVEQEAVANGLDPALLAGLLKHESAWIPNNRSNRHLGSRDQAKGLAQLMDDTARELGVSNPDDPKQAIPAAAKYLSKMMKMFGNDPIMALRAYNQGPGNQQRFPQGRGAQAQAYPDKVLADARIYGYGQTGAGYASPELMNPRISRAVSRTFDSGQPGLDLYFENKQFPAVLPGRVKEVGYQGSGRGASGKGYGNFVVVESVDPATGKPVDIIYAHLDGVDVKEGQRLKEGQVLGKQGGTGRVLSQDGTIASIDFLAPAPKGSGSMSPYSNYQQLRQAVSRKWYGS